MRFIVAAIALVSAASVAQELPTGFPQDSVPITNESLATLVGNKFVGKRFDGRTWSMEFGPDGAFRMSQSGSEGGWMDGRVRVDGTKLCQEMRRSLESGCNDVRLKDGVLLYKRNSNGEVVTLIAQ